MEMNHKIDQENKCLIFQIKNVLATNKKVYFPEQKVNQHFNRDFNEKIKKNSDFKTY